MTFIRSLLIVVSCCILLQSYCYAQEKSNIVFGKVSPGDFAVPARSIIDSGTKAVILSNIGSVKFVGNEKGWFSYLYKVQTRILFLKKTAMDLATVKFQLYNSKHISEKVDKIEASTYNLEGGNVVETKLAKTDIFYDKLDNERKLGKFTLPAVKEGSIIEYTYTILSDYTFNLPAWQFQSEDYPTLWSEYDFDCPQTLSYVFSKQGFHKFSIDKGKEGHETYNVKDVHDNGSYVQTDDRLTVSANTVIHQWVMKDVPPFREENYISTPRNYTDRIEFQLAATYNGDSRRDVMNSWKEVNRDLMEREDFGVALNEEDSWVKDFADKNIPNKTDQAEQARAVYYYVSNNFTCTDYWGRYVTTSLKDVIRKSSGTVGDLNLLLIALLRIKGIQADPVMLSTRDHGFSSPNYPVLDRLNYVIARATVSNQVVYLDASQPYLGYGSLPSYCYNGYARIISNTDSGSVYFWADSLKERQTTMVMIMPDEKGELKGSFQTTLGNVESFRMRKTIAKMGQPEYFKTVQAALGPDNPISATGIDSLEKKEEPVRIYFDFNMNHAADPSLIYFNPMFSEAIKENPFKAAERQYPVEMDYATDDTYILNMEIPEGYEVDEMPKSAKVALNGNSGSFEYLIARQDNTVQLRVRLRLNQAFFSAEEYGFLRDFYAFVVKKESETIVLKKKATAKP